MKRTESTIGNSSLFNYEDDQDDDSPYRSISREADGAAIVRNIASFLTFSDAASLVSFGGDFTAGVTTPADSWAVGLGICTDSSSFSTPPTPGLVALSPGATPHPYEVHENDVLPLEGTEDDSSDYMRDLLKDRQRRWLQEKLASYVFSHPLSLREFCMDAYVAARERREQQEKMLICQTDPETLREPCVREPHQSHPRKQQRHSKKGLRAHLLEHVAHVLFHNVPLSVLLDALDALGHVTVETTQASTTLTMTSVSATVHGLRHAACSVWQAVVNFNPFQLLEAIISLHFNAMGKTSEVLVSGIQSVATGVGSASSLALHRLSTANLSVHRTGSSSSLAASVKRPARSALNGKLLKKLSEINETARLFAYEEKGDPMGGMTKRGLDRARRMLHNSNVSFRPFVAVVSASPSIFDGEWDGGSAEHQRSAMEEDGDSSSVTSSPLGSPFMRTPASFPTTPHSRQRVIEKSSRFFDDRLFIARDRLRINEALDSDDERTRDMARLLVEKECLPVFDRRDMANGIDFTCGEHIATKVGSLYYASTRSVVPILRNCFVYFEMTVIPYPGLDLLASLSIGLSTQEMPPNNPVGAWLGSVGLCTTGQILLAGQWLAPKDPSRTSYGAGSTVGCLVFLDDDSAFETWDGPMVRVSVTFNVNGVPIGPVAPSTPNRDSGADGGIKEGCSPCGVAETGDIHKQAYLPTLTLLVPAAEDLYPTVTIQSLGTAVLSRFSGGDITPVSRDNVGVPDRVPVYAVDGTAVLVNGMS